MPKILIAYFTKSGNTRTMAESVAEGARGVADCEVVLKPINEIIEAAEMLDYDGFVVGSPVYYGMPAAPIKQLFDNSVVLHGRLAGRVGAAFASSGNVGGGNETTCMAILQMMLVHGMFAVGAAQGDHYGPVAVGKPDKKSLAQCVLHGKRTAKLVAALAGQDMRV